METVQNCTRWAKWQRGNEYTVEHDMALLLQGVATSNGMTVDGTRNGSSSKQTGSHVVAKDPIR